MLYVNLFHDSQILQIITKSRKSANFFKRSTFKIQPAYFSNNEYN